MITVFRDKLMIIQGHMNKIVEEMSYKDVIVYIDDVFIYCKEITQTTIPSEVLIKKSRDYKYRKNIEKIQYL